MITIEQARELYQDTDSAHDFAHILRVLGMAEKLAQAEGADLAVVRTAALLHDIARPDEDRSEEKLDHAELSARRAHALLLERGVSAEFADRVAEAIRAHRFRGTEKPRTLEAQILFDADKLDSIGAIGVARAFAVAGSLNQKLYTEPDGSAQATREQHNREHSPVAEFHVKLSKLVDRFYTPTAQRLAADRHRYMVEFFERLGQEVHGDK